MTLEYNFFDEYNIEIIDGSEIKGLKDVKYLVVYFNEDNLAISFRKIHSFPEKRNPIIDVPLKSISIIRTITIPKGILNRKCQAIELIFDQNLDGISTQKTIKFFVEESKLEVFVNHMSYLKKSETNPLYKEQIGIHLKRCIKCFNNDSKSFMLCESCYSLVYGKVILYYKSAEYHGGHKAYPSGGKFNKHESGDLILNERSIFFIKYDKEKEKE